MLARLNWLHLSDWHQGKSDFDRKLVAEKLLEDIRKRTAISSALSSIDFVVFSGDLAASGKDGEFEAAWHELLSPILTTLSLQPDRLFIVPGNHDIERTRFRFLPTALTQAPASREDTIEWLVKEEDRGKLLDPFLSYNAFIRRYLPHQSSYASAVQTEIQGSTIGIAGLNSALMCARNRDQKNNVQDQGYLVVGEPQARQAIEVIAESQVRIVVVHHPFDWLASFDRDDVETYLMSKTHFLLTGHVHKGGIHTRRGTSGDCVIIPAGAGYDKRRTDTTYQNAYNFVSLDLAGGTGEIFFRHWSELNKEWRRFDEAATDGKSSFVLPQDLRRSVAVEEKVFPLAAERPIRILVIGPLTGDHSAFGLSQARGIIAALFHALEEATGVILAETNPAGTNRFSSYFDIEWLDSNHCDQLTNSLRDRLSKIYGQVGGKEKAPDVVFGPMHSQEAVDAFMRPTQLKVTVPTILITAATTEIDEHEDYGLRLLRPAPTLLNLSQYAAVFSYYYVSRGDHPCDAVIILYRDDEYGRTTFGNIKSSLRGKGLRIEGCSYESTESNVEMVLDEMIRTQLRSVVEGARCPLVFVGDTGPHLRQLTKYLAAKLPTCTVATLSSVNAELLTNSDLNGLYVLGTFCPDAFSLNEPVFRRYINAAQRYLKRTDPFTSVKWSDPDNVDAEVHDSAIFWLDQMSETMPRFMPRVFRDLYITNLRMVRAGSPRRLRNATAIAVFRVIDNRLQVVHVGRNSRDRGGE